MTAVTASTARKASPTKRLLAPFLAFAAAAALSMALAPAAAYAESEISGYNELVAACGSGGTYTLTDGITYSGDREDYPKGETTITIDLADHTINVNGAY